eukprot:UN20139
MRAIISDGIWAFLAAEAIIRVLLSLQAIVHRDRVRHHVDVKVKQIGVLFLSDAIFLLR